MRRSFYLWLVLTIFLAALPVASTASQPVVRPLADPADSLDVTRIVTGFFDLAIGKPFDPDSIDSYAIDTFAEQVKKLGVEPMWPEGTSYTIDRVVAVGEGDDAVMISAVTTADSLPYFGPYAIDWTFYMARNEQREWRIGMMRRMAGIDGAIQTLRFLDTSSFYPAALKRTIAKEKSTILLSNTQLRRHLENNRDGFRKLLGEFTRRDSLKMLGRVDRRVAQLNRHGIFWGMAAEDVPQEAIDEFMKQATPAERKEMEARLRYAESLRRNGNDTLKLLAKKYRLTMKRIDGAIAMMKSLHVDFVNADLPWRGAVQFTLAGGFGNAVGYIYSPHGEVPVINPDEYFYLEDLGGGWWLFRST